MRKIRKTETTVGISDNGQYWSMRVISNEEALDALTKKLEEFGVQEQDIISVGVEQHTWSKEMHNEYSISAWAYHWIDLPEEKTQ